MYELLELNMMIFPKMKLNSLTLRILTQPSSSSEFRVCTPPRTLYRAMINQIAHRLGTARYLWTRRARGPRQILHRFRHEAAPLRSLDITPYSTQGHKGSSCQARCSVPTRRYLASEGRLYTEVPGQLGSRQGCPLW